MTFSAGRAGKEKEAMKKAGRDRPAGLSIV